MGGHGGYRWAAQFARLVAAVVLVPLTFTLGAGSAGAIDESFVFVTSSAGHELGLGADHLQHGIVHSSLAPNRHRFATTSGPSTIVIDVRAVTGELVAGAFWDLREPEYGEAKPGFRLTIDGRTCATLGGGMIIDDVAFDGAGQLVRLTMRFAPRCTGESIARLAGTLAYHSAVPAPARRLTPPGDTIHMTVGESRVAPVGFENTGPSAITITGLGVVDSRVVSGSGPVIWGGTRGTCPPVVPSGVSCTLEISLNAFAEGTAVYNFAMYDSLSANQFDERYVLFPVGVELTIAVESTGQTSTTAPTTTAPTTTTTIPVGSTASSTVPPRPSSTAPPVATTTGDPEPTVTIEPWTPIAVDPPPYSTAGNPDHGYVPVGPRRVLDTRDGTNIHVGPMRSGERYRFDVSEAAGIPTDLVDAVALNVTVVGAAGPGHLSVFPSGDEVPDSSNLNFDRGRAVANMVIVGVGESGAIDLLEGPAGSDVIVDIVGWYGDAPAGTTASAQFALSPSRVFDTRWTNEPFTGGSTRAVQLGGKAGVPADATAVIVNVTATDVTQPTYVTLSPWGEARPATSSLNVIAGETRPNLAIVQLDRSGRAALFLERGHADLIIDVVGYFAPGAGGTFLALDPERLVDTRFDDEPVFPEELILLGAGDTFEGYRITGVVLNVTATDADRDGYLSVFPGDATSLPEVSNVNYPAGSAVPNLVVTKIGDGAVVLYNALGTVDVLVDVMGLIVE